MKKWDILPKSGRKLAGILRVLHFVLKLLHVENAIEYCYNKLKIIVVLTDRPTETIVEILGLQTITSTGMTDSENK